MAPREARVRRSAPVKLGIARKAFEIVEDHDETLIRLASR